jgi:hypothetical protein
MPFSLMNGLSGLGQGVAAFAGQAGLEAQKADLAKQNLMLADQLATTRETAGRAQAGDIAALAEGKRQAFESGENVLQRQSAQTIAQTGAAATLGAAGISAGAERYRSDTQSKDVYAQIAAAEPGRAQEILASQQRAALEAVQTENAKALQTAHTNLQTELGNATPDPAKVATLKSQVTSLETSASTEAQNTSAAALMYRTDMDAVTHLNTQLQTATQALNSPDMSDTDKVAQKGVISNLQKQLLGAQRSLQASHDLVQSRVNAATGAPPPVAPGNRPPLSSFSGGAAQPGAQPGPPGATPSSIANGVGNGPNVFPPLSATPGPNDPDFGYVAPR